MVMGRVERHTLLMRNEVRLEHIREEHDSRLRALEHYEKAERSRREQEYHVIETGIAPRFYHDKLDWFHGRVCQGTGKWLLKDPVFIKWLEGSDPVTKLVWLRGNPGVGN